MYLDNNDLPGISPCVLLEAGKVAMQAELYLLFIQKKDGETLVLELEQKIKSLESAYASSSQEHTSNNLRKLKQ